MTDLLDDLANSIEKQGFTIKFGLEQQGHIETIESELKRWNSIGLKGDYPKSDMKYCKQVWDDIGKKIGWCPLSAALHYFEYLDKKS